MIGRTLVAAATAAVVMGASAPKQAPAPADATDSWADEDWAVFSDRVRWAVAAGLDTVDIGTAMARLGETFVGTAYVPGTLDPDGPERVVVDFRRLDCVTFVETVFATARFVRTVGSTALDDRPAAEARYEDLLTDLRYRDGRLNGYASRLHYFSDWMADNARRGRVVDLADALGAVADTEPIDFMSTHAEAYRQLADPSHVEAVRQVEARLTAAGRRFVPEDLVASVADRIRDGDIIAATSTVAGLDVAHTGLALWRDGRLHLLHAPLVGSAVEVSAVPLADRIRAQAGQDGVMVVRPVAS